MPEFISKLQYSICEDGEFFDEKKRSPVQIMELIKSFRWEIERPFADTKLTGPSVTIQDEHENYLKIELYNDEMFCFYLDSSNHIYELNVPNIDAACVEVESFFNSRLDLQYYKKHFFNIGNKAHFVTKDFIYKTTLWKTLSASINFIIFFLAACYFLITLNPTAPLSVTILISIAILLPAGMLAYIFIRYFSCSDQSIKISRGNDTFYWGYGINEIKYNKNDITKIIVYQPGGTRKMHYFYVFEIWLKDASVLKFSNMLMSESEFLKKFPTDAVTYGDKSPLWQI